MTNIHNFSMLVKHLSCCTFDFIYCGFSSISLHNKLLRNKNMEQTFISPRGLEITSTAHADFTMLEINLEGFLPEEVYVSAHLPDRCHY